MGAYFSQANITELTRESGVLFSLCADDIYVLETGSPIEAQVRQILFEKSKAFSKKKDRYQREYYNCNESVTAEKTLDCCFGAYAAAGCAFFWQNRQPWRGRFHTCDDAKRPP